MVKYLIIFFAVTASAFGLQVGDRLKPLSESHQYFNQIGTVVDINVGANSTQAKVDWTGDGVKDGQVIVEYTWSYEVIDDSVDNRPITSDLWVGETADDTRTLQNNDQRIYFLDNDTEAYVVWEFNGDYYYRFGTDVDHRPSNAFGPPKVLGTQQNISWSFTSFNDGGGDTGGGDDDNSTGGGDDGHGGGDDGSGGGDDGSGGGDDGSGGGDDGGGSDDGGGTDNNSTTGPVDTDDDVPMLTEIYNRLATLDKDSTNYQDYDSNTLNNIWERQADIAGLIQERETQVVRMAKLSDLEISLRTLSEDIKDARGEILDENGTAIDHATLKDIIASVDNNVDGLRGNILDENGTLKKATLADIYNILKQEEEVDQNVSDTASSALESTFNSMEQQATDYVNSLSAIPTEGGEKLNTLFEMNAGGFNFYLDPINNVFSGGIDLGVNWEQVANWIQLVIGFAFVIIYFQAQLYHVARVLDLLMEAPVSAPVTTIPQIFVKITLYALLIGSAVWGGILTIWEADLTIFGSTGQMIDIFGTIKDLLTGNGWGSMALNMMFDLIPVGVLVYLATMYWVSRAVLQFINLSGLTILKMKT